MSRAEQQRRRNRRKDRKDREWRQKTGYVPSKLPGRIVRRYQYDITSDPIKLPEDDNAELDQALEDIRDDLYDQARNSPKSAIPKLLALLERFPGSRTLLNWLGAAYQLTGEEENARSVIRHTYRLHPQYLFARTAYANLLLGESKPEEAAQVMEHKWDLGALYPHRHVFHETEFVSLCQVAFRYFVVTGETEQAHALYDLFQQYDPDHPLTSQMHKVLKGSLFVRMMQRLVKGRRES